MVFWLAATPLGAIKASQKPILFLYIIFLVVLSYINYIKKYVLFIILAMVFWLAATPLGAIKASQKPILFLYLIFLVVLSYN